MTVQVSSDHLRVAARKLREETAEQLRKAAAQLEVPEKSYGVEAAFDTYTTAAAYREYATAMEEEFRMIEEACRQLADALEQTAADYDRADQQSSVRVESAQRVGGVK
ncbi:type VII secretion target [Actinoplanes sp. NPDC026619]|uniref:type VII secretion target n=1 Tax=Actinoplanes sp. NPDC026619 TaxID=3155798 RepID=UPI0033FAC4F9